MTSHRVRECDRFRRSVLPVLTSSSLALVGDTLVLCLAGCDAGFLKLPGSAPSVFPVPAMFREQARALVQQGATMQAATGQGTTAEEFGNSLISVKAAYDIAKGTWPPVIRPSLPSKTSTRRFENGM